MPMSKKKAPRKKVPKTLAVINADNCTGCESCREVCPVDCIDFNQIGLGTKGNQSWCEIDLERCVGCEVCVLSLIHISEPTRRYAIGVGL